MVVRFNGRAALSLGFESKAGWQCEDWALRVLKRRPACPPLPHSPLPTPHSPKLVKLIKRVFYTSAYEPCPDENWRSNVPPNGGEGNYERYY
jgi:hypothetical protein